MKQLSLSVTVLLTCFVGASFRAHAQADESWYQAALKHNASTNKQRVAQWATHPTISKRSNLPGTGSRNIVNACDIMVNGGFETQLAVPSHVNNMGGDYSGNNRPDQLSGWYSPTAGSPDYFATNATATSEVQPSNENSPYGSFTPYLATSNNDGLEGAIGLYARQSYYDSNYNTQRDRTSEYAQIDLGQPLPNGQYYVDFQVSLSHNTSTSLATNYGVNNGFGLVFSNTPNLSIIGSGLTTPTRSSRDFLAIPSAAQTVFNQSPIAQNAINYGVTGAANWQRVSGQISSTGNLRYVTVGLFNSDPANQVALPNHRTDLYNTYFFVDAIRIFKVSTAGPAVSIYCGNSATIGEICSIPGATYTWSAPGVTGLPVNSSTIQTTVSPTATTTYTLTVTLPNGVSSSSQVTVTVLPPVSSSTPPTAITFSGEVMWNQIFYMQNPRPVHDGSYMCQGSTLVLNVSTSGSTDGSAPDWFIDQMTASQYTISYSSDRLQVYFSPNVPNYGQPEHPATFDVTFHDACHSPYSRRFTIVSEQGRDTRYPCDDNTEGPHSGGGNNPGGGGGGGGGPIGDEPCDCVVAYPNPATETLTLPAEATQATLLDSHGQPVKTTEKGTIDVRNLPAGLYNLRMMQKGKAVNQHLEIKH